MSDRITGESLARELADYVNDYSMESEDFINAFCKQHRTLQQSAFRLLLQLVEHVASDEYRTDGRNEGSQQVAKDLIEGFKKLKDWPEAYPSQFLGFI